MSGFQVALPVVIHALYVFPGHQTAIDRFRLSPSGKLEVVPKSKYDWLP